MKGYLRPQIFYAPFSKCVQCIWKQLRPLETILCFSRWSRKRTPTASQKQKQIGLKFSIFCDQFLVQEFSSFFNPQSRLHDQAITMNQGKCVLSRNTDNYKFWNKFLVIGNLLRWTPFVVFQTYSSPFFDQISFKRYLQPVIWGFTALWGRKNYKDRRILMK